MGNTAEGRAEVEAIGRRHDVPVDAVTTLLAAIRRGGGRQAQFSHPALGGMGQWSRGGGIMIGDMFNHALKANVEQLCIELADKVGDDRLLVAEASDSGRVWWPRDLGRPSAVGSQNDEGYACFPEARRLAIRDSGGVQLYDTGDHRISGVSQHQGSTRDLSFTSQHGIVRLSDLRRLQDDRSRPEPPATTSSEHHAPIHSEVPAPRKAAPHADGDVIGLIERLHDLQRNGVLTAEEFAAKKTELLARI